MEDEKPGSPFDSIAISPAVPEKEASEEEQPVQESLMLEPVEQEPAGQGEPPPSPRQQGVIRFVLWARWPFISLLLLYLSYILAGYTLVPYVFASFLPHKLSVSTERPVTVGSAEFNPFTGVLTLRNGIIGPRLTNPDDTVDPILSFSRCRIDLEISSLFRRGIICRELTLDQFFLHLVRRPDATYNVTELLPPVLLNGMNGKDPETGGLFAGLPPFSLNNISVSDSRLIFDDLSAAKTHIVEEISLALPTLGNVSYQASKYISPAFSARINGSPIRVAGRTDLSPGGGVDTSLDLQMESVDLPSYLAYLPPEYRPDLAGGRAELSLVLRFSTGKPAAERLQVEGSANIAELQIRDEQGVNRISLPAIRMKGVVFPLAGRFHLQELICNRPEINLERTADGLLTLPGIVTDLWRESASQPATAEVTIDHLVVTGGRLLFVDRSVAGGYLDTWTDIDLTVGEDHTLASDPEQPARFAVNARHEGTDGKTAGRLHGEGEISVPSSRISGTVQVEDLSLVPYQPYIVTLIGEDGRITQGRAGMTGRFSLSLGREGQETEFAIEDASLSIEKIGVAARDRDWFKAATFVCSQASITGSQRVIDFGRVLVEDGNVLFRYDPQGKLMLSSFRPDSGDRKTAGSERHEGNAKGEWRTVLQSLRLNRFVVMIDRQPVAPGMLAGREHSPEPGQTVSLRLDDMSVQLSDLSPQKRQQWRKQAIGSTRINGQGRVDCRGALSGPPFGAELDCNLNEMKLIDLAPFFKDWFTPAVAAGMIKASVTMRLPDFSFSGEAAVDDFVATLDGREVFRWRKVVARELHFTPWTALQIAHLEVDSPSLFWTLKEDGESSLRNIFVVHQTAAPQHAEPARLEIGKINFADARLVVADLSVAPPYKTTITGSGTVSSLANRAGKPAAISAKGLLEKVTPLRLTGELGLFAPEPFLDYQLTATGVDLAAFSPYLEPELGSAIDGGTLAVVIDYRQEKGQIVGENHLVVGDFQLGAKKQQGTNAALTAALMMQPGGRMEFDIPVSGDAADPAFSYRKSVAKALRSLQIKAAVSPFLLLEDLLESAPLSAVGRRQIAQLSFPFGQEKFAVAEKEKLAALAHVLRERPWLTLTIKGFADGKGDREAIMAERKKQAVYKQVVEEIRRSEALSKAYGKEEIPTPAPGMPDGRPEDTVGKRPPAIKVDEAELLELAQKRSLAVRRYLVDELKIEGGRLTVGGDELVSADSVGRSGNRVDFVLGSSLETH
jgi:uncharacterized protein involved in outer membrane biogenesis/outer membrane protein OmpA-like peptidoglycan-associated protein